MGLFNFSDIFPLRDCQFGELNMTIKCPQKSEKFLELKFTDGWRTPVKKRHGNFVCGNSTQTPTALRKRFKSLHADAKVLPINFGGNEYQAWYACMDANVDQSHKLSLESVWYHEPEKEEEKKT